MVEFGLWIRHAGLSFKDIRETSLVADRVGFNSIWFFDHFFPVEDDTPLKNSLLECWSIVSSVASITQQARIGTLVLCNSYRYPSLLAKMASSVDNISNGRLEFGIGAGYRKQEYFSYGIPFPSFIQRIEQLKESLKIMKLMWTEDEPTFTGKYYKIDKAIMYPKPIQKPHPPIIIGGRGESILEVAAEFADRYDTAGWETVEEYKERIAALKEKCENIGRNVSQITMIWHAQVVIEEDEKEVESRIHTTKDNHPWDWIRNMSSEEYRARCVVGTPEECVERFRQYQDLGASYFIVHFSDMESVKLFAKQVIPKFKRKK